MLNCFDCNAFFKKTILFFPKKIYEQRIYCITKIIHNIAKKREYFDFAKYSPFCILSYFSKLAYAFLIFTDANLNLSCTAIIASSISFSAINNVILISDVEII